MRTDETKFVRISTEFLPASESRTYNLIVQDTNAKGKTMNNSQITNLRPGDVFDEVMNGKTTRRRVCAVGVPVMCSNEGSGAYGGWAIQVEEPSGTGNGWVEWMIESDEYLSGSGYVTHQDGVRIRGCEFVRMASNDEQKDAYRLSSEARRSLQQLGEL